MPEFSTIQRFNLETNGQQVLWDEAMGGVASGLVDAEGEILYVVAQERGSETIAVFQYEAEQWSELLKADIRETNLSLLQACGKGGLIFMQTDQVPDKIIHLQQHLYRLHPDGRMQVFSPLYMNTYPIGC